jgi:hypothetical protein
LWKLYFSGVLRLQYIFKAQTSILLFHDDDTTG